MMDAIRDAVVWLSEPASLKPVFAGSQAIQAVYPDPNTKPEKPLGLGILCGEFVFTCAHFYGALPLGYLDLCMFTATRTCDSSSGRFAMHVATTQDVMVLAPNSITAASGEDDGPTSSAWDIIYAYQENHPPLRPACLSFPPHRPSGVVGGFFFAPDGKTVCRTSFRINDGAPDVRFATKYMKDGCSGGPLVTDDMKIIGVATNHSNILDHEGRNECIGKRIDLCVPMCLHGKLDWETVAI